MELPLLDGKGRNGTMGHTSTTTPAVADGLWIVTV